MPSVFVMVFDGLQPSQVTPELMPGLAAFADEGVRFTRHHAVFPTVTRINAASIVTGRYPGGHGLAANLMVMRSLDPSVPFQVLEPDLRRLAAASGGRVLLAPPLGDILAPHGLQYVAVGAGTSGNAYAHNPHPDSSLGATIHPDFCLPDDLHSHLLSRFGPWPGEALPNDARVRHAGRILTEYVLPERAPAVALLWSSEPDKSQHAAGVNSELSRQALAAADAEFTRVLRWLEDNGRAGDTDVLVASDHGYSTITEVVPVETLVRDAGFPPGGAPGGVVVAPNGGSVLFYSDPLGPGTIDRLAEWLMSQPWCGSLLASRLASPGGLPAGTLPAALAGGEGERGPDLMMSFAWDSRPNAAGVPGHAFASGGAAGVGQHGSMSRHDLRATLIARGPRFKSGLASEVPSGNVDLAPTILRLLGLGGGDQMDGRVLWEALTEGPDPSDVEVSVAPHDAERQVGGGVYRQTVQTSHVGGTSYLDEGRATRE